MSTGRTLNIVNYFGTDVDCAVTLNNWNCCDMPLAGQSIGRLGPNTRTSFQYARKDGHGCDGRQGEFQLAFETNCLIDMNFDSDGDIQLGSVSANCSAFLLQDPDGNYTMVVGNHVN